MANCQSAIFTLQSAFPLIHAPGENVRFRPSFSRRPRGGAERAPPRGRRLNGQDHWVRVSDEGPQLLLLKLAGEGTTVQPGAVWETDARVSYLHVQPASENSC